MSMAYISEQPKALQANQVSDDERRFMLDNSKKMHLNDIAKILKRKSKWVKNQCQRIGCGYTTQVKEQL